MNVRKLKKELGMKSTMKLRDYLGVRIDEDRPDLLEEVRGYCEAEYGDFLWIITFEAPKLKRKRKII